MKRLLIVLFVLASFVPTAHAQLFEAVGNPIVVAGGTYQFEKPELGQRTAFMLSANIAGVKVGNIPLYFGGVGVALPSTVSDVAAQFGDYVMLTVPGVTWYPSGNSPGTLGKLCLQTGYSYVLNGDAKARSGIYAAVGFSWDSPAYLGYKRAVKRAKVAGVKAGSAEYPKNPYDK